VLEPCNSIAVGVNKKDSTVGSSAAIAGVFVIPLSAIHTPASIDEIFTLAPLVGHYSTHCTYKDKHKKY
jgi:hypothetical protein